MHTATLVDVGALDVRYGPRTVLGGVRLTVGAGGIHGLLGPRGAGKTTLLRVLAGEIAPSAGAVRVSGASALVGDDLTPMALARAVGEEPAVLLVDEPPAGFSGETAAATRALVTRQAARGGAVVWATRRLETLAGVAGGVTVLAGGRVRYSGSVETLARRVLAKSVQDAVDELEAAA